MGYSAVVGMDYILFSGNSETKEARCWNLLAQCPLTHKMMFGKKCTKITYDDSVVYVDTDTYSYELMIREPWPDNPFPPAFYAFGRIGPKPGY